MLTVKQIEDVSELNNCIGEARLGYIRETESCIDGPPIPVRSRAANKGKKQSKSEAISVCLEFEADVETGEIRAVRK